MKLSTQKDFLPISAEEIFIITPTFDRVKQLHRLLKTLSEQTFVVGGVLVADGFGNAKSVTDAYRDKIPTSWISCPIRGQIPQRNYALNFLPSDCKVVIYFDDDIQLYNNAIEEMINFWNDQLYPPGGVSFKITNLPSQKNSFFRHIFFMATEPYGRVFKSGYNSPCGYDEHNPTLEWLPGGVTAWRKDILISNPMLNISSKWAVCEDLIFSYPVGKKESLYLCDNAKVKHVDDVVRLGFKTCVSRGKNAFLWRMYFVINNPELSIPHFYWMNIGLFIGYGIRSFKGKRNQLGYMAGTLVGMVYSSLLLLPRVNIRDLMQ